MTDMNGSQTPPAGWYPDQTGTLRWWDGTQWTSATQPPYGAPGLGAQAPARLDAGTSVDTVWIWLVVLLPLVTLVPTIGFLTRLSGGMVQLIEHMPIDDPNAAGQFVASNQLALVFTPWYVATVLCGLVVYGLTAWFAYLDSRTLRARGVVRPFHWAWIFLSGWVYVIGRTVIVRRQSGRGMAPLWVFLAIQIGTMILALVWMFAFLGELARAIAVTSGTM